MRLISADGRWWWNGREWQPLPKAVDAVAAEESPESTAVASEAAPDVRPEAAPAVADGTPKFMPGQYVKSRTEVPDTGIARRLYDLSGGRINLGPNPAELRHLRLLHMARTPVSDPPVHLAVASAKGGVGKSTMALLIASKMGLLRNDRIIAVECNPHHGTFRSRVPTHHDRSIKDLIDYLDSPESRLEVVTAPTDPRIRNALSANDYRRVFSVLERYFDIIILDLGTGLL